MPLYNKRPYVRRAVESVLNQSFSNWEMIVIDDGSTDGSPDEIPREDQRIKLYHQENSGPGAARNRGIRQAQGEYVTFLDADDYYYPDKLKVEMKLLHEERRSQWMMSTFEYEMNGTVTKKNIFDINGRELEAKPQVFEDALRQVLLSGWAPHGLCIRKDLLESIGCYREDMLWLEITELHIRCALVEPKILILPKPLFRVVGIADSISRVESRRTEGMRQMGEILYELSNDYPAYADILIHKSKQKFISYIAKLLLSGEKAKARQFLNNNYPYEHDTEWWQMIFGSWMPNQILQFIISKRKLAN